MKMYKLIAGLLLIINSKQTFGREDWKESYVVTHESRVVDVTETWKYTCASIIPANNQSQIVQITWIAHYTFNGTCVTWDYGPINTLFNLTLRDGSVNTIVANTDYVVPITTKANKYLLIYGNITGACSGDSYGRIGKYPLKELKKCIAGECDLTETSTSLAYFITIGPACGFNICTGYNKESFPQGLN